LPDTLELRSVRRITSLVLVVGFFFLHVITSVRLIKCHVRGVSAADEYDDDYSRRRQCKKYECATYVSFVTIVHDLY
jgi:hypothetical protein